VELQAESHRALRMRVRLRLRSRFVWSIGDASGEDAQ
jgi:hypothetical protein